MSKRKAVSILLTRDPDSTEVFLVERNPKLKFFGGYFAFPGGTLDREDADIAITNAEAFAPELLPYLVAAAREVFEETGVLLAEGQAALAPEVRAAYRKALLAGERDFTDILQETGLVLDAAYFHPLCNITTPEFAPVRYDTQFFWVKVPEAQAPEIWPGELVSGAFFRAEDALARWHRGEMLIVPPILLMLKALHGSSVRAFVSEVRRVGESYARGALHQVYFTPGVQMVTLRTATLPPATHTNTYLVGESELYVVDPAPSEPAEQARFWDYLDAQLREGRKLRAILLTHHHSDHVGALPACQRRYHLPVWAHRHTAEKLAGVRVDRQLDDGEELPLGTSPDGQPGWHLTVYHTPGHARGHLCFQESRYRALLAGDLISTVSTIVISPPEGHLATYLRSLERLETLADGTLYPSHGPAVRDGRAVVRYYLQHRREREQKLLQALSATPQSLRDLVQQVYDDVEPNLWPLAERSLLAGLEKLMEEEKCERVGEAYRRVA